MVMEDLLEAVTPTALGSGIFDLNVDPANK
jgi:hypothetical protein